MPTITIRLTEQQKAQVEEAADLAMVSVSEFVRSALMVCTDNIESRMARDESAVLRRALEISLIAPPVDSAPELAGSLIEQARAELGTSMAQLADHERRLYELENRATRS